MAEELQSVPSDEGQVTSRRLKWKRSKEETDELHPDANDHRNDHIAPLTQSLFYTEDEFIELFGSWIPLPSEYQSSDWMYAEPKTDKLGFLRVRLVHTKAKDASSKFYVNSPPFRCRLIPAADETSDSTLLINKESVENFRSVGPHFGMAATYPFLFDVDVVKVPKPVEEEPKSKKARKSS